VTRNAGEKFLLHAYTQADNRKNSSFIN